MFIYTVHVLLTEALEGHLLLIFDVLLFITYNLLLINYYLLLKF